MSGRVQSARWGSIPSNCLERIDAGVKGWLVVRSACRIGFVVVWGCAIAVHHISVVDHILMSLGLLGFNLDLERSNFQPLNSLGEPGSQVQCTVSLSNEGLSLSYTMRCSEDEKVIDDSK